MVYRGSGRVVFESCEREVGDAQKTTTGNAEEHDSKLEVYSGSFGFQFLGHILRTGKYSASWCPE